MSMRGRPILQFGLLPRMLKTEEMALHNLDVSALRPPAEPTGSGAISNYATSMFNNALSNYNKQEQELATAASKIHDALGETAKQLLTGSHGILISDLKLILEQLDAQYLVVTKKEIDQATREPEEKFQPGSDFRKLVATQKRIHSTLEDAKELLSLHMKINYLVLAVESVKALYECVDAYMRGQPDRTSTTTMLLQPY
jgi:hypothetical protein